jgi:hypothetical protein
MVVRGSGFHERHSAAGSGGGGTNLSLLHFDGTAGSTSFPDFYSANTWTAHGAAQIGTTAPSPQFGTGSLLLDGSTAWITTPDRVPLDFGSSDFTIECWVNPQTQFHMAICSKQNDFLFEMSSSAGPLRFLSTGPSVNFNTGANAVSASVWTHVAMVRHGNVWTIYIAGVASGTQTASGAITSGGNGISIGSNSFATLANPWFGNIDEFRLSPLAQYTSNFTPPSMAFAS